MRTIDEMIKMVECCYFTGACKLCPYYKAPKFGAIGKCEGMRKVGTDLIDLMCWIKAETLKQQPDLFTGLDDQDPPAEHGEMIPVEDLAGCSDKKLWMEDDDYGGGFVKFTYPESGEYARLYVYDRDCEIVRALYDYGVNWKLYQAAPDIGA